MMDEVESDDGVQDMQGVEDNKPATGQNPEVPLTCAKKKKKKKKKSPGSASSSSGSEASSSSSGDSALRSLTPEQKTEIDRRFGLALEEASKDKEEIISLDSCFLKNSQLNKLVERLKDSKQLMTLVLTNNLLSDDACKSLRAALSRTDWCPELMSVDVRGNKNMTAEGIKLLVAVSDVRPSVHVWCGSFAEDPPEESFDDLLKAGSMPLPDTEPRASPSELWSALRAVLESPPGEDHVSRVSELVRDISDSVVAELFREEVLESTFEGAQTMPTTHTVCMPPREYSNFALAQLPLLHTVLDIVPRKVPSTAWRVPTAGVGSHRFHASVLVCQLIRAAFATPQGAALVAPLVASNIFPRVAHLALSHPNSSCMHATLLGALCGGTLAKMPRPLWGPLLLENFGLPAGKPAGAKALSPLPQVILQTATRALKQKIGQRSGLVGLIVTLGTLLADTAAENAELQEALGNTAQWSGLVTPGGPLEQLKAEQVGGLGGGKPAAMGGDAMFDEATNSAKEMSRVMLGIRDFSFMHQSLNLASALH